MGNVRPAGAAAALPTASGTRFEAIVAAAPHSQLIALGLVVALVSSGLLIARLRKGAPKTTGSKASRKQKDHALRKIMQAQAASNNAGDEIAPPTAATQASGPGDRDRVRAGTGTSSRPNGTANPESDASRRPVLSRVNTAVGGSIAAAAELLPSPSCVTSSSTVIWNGLERIGSALSATASRARSGSLSGGSSAVSTKGKEREADRGGLEEDVSAAQMRRRDSTRSSESHTPPVADGAGRRPKGKKGKNPTGSQMMSPTTSSQGFTSALTSPAISRRGSEKGNDSGRLPDRTAAVQPLSSLPGNFPIGEPRRTSQQMPGALAPIQPPARLEKPPDPKPPLPPAAPPKQTSDAFVQTSPRLLPLPASPPLQPSDSDATPPPTLPPAARSVGPLRPFDLHASFQTTTALPSSTGTEPLLSLDDYSVTNTTAYLSTAVSPPISPSMSRAPSAAESASSNSPISARASSPLLGSPPITHARPLPPSFERRGSAVSVNGHLAVGTLERTPSGSSSPVLPTARSRKAARKASANETAHAGQQGVVGLPGAVAAPRRSSEADRSRSIKGGKSPKDDNGGSNIPLRRASATSSGASANSGGRGADGSRSSAGDDPYHQQVQQQRWPVSGDRIYGYPALGIRNDEDDDLPSEGGSELDRRSSSAAGEGHLPAGFSSRSNHFMSPDTSPHPSQRSISSSQYTPSNQRTPWSPHMTSQYAPVAGSPSAHSASRPPSRGSSLSVPVAMTPLSAAGPTPHQQALALAQSQLQTQSQIMLQYQHMQAVQQRQSHPSQGPILRRRATSGGLSETSDGLLSPTTTATPATPNGFGFPFGVLTSPLMGSSPSAQPSWSAHSSGLGPHMMPYSSGPSSPYPGLSQTSSPTTASFPSGAFTPQIPPHAILAHPNGVYQSANSGGGAGYFAAPAGQASPYGPMQQPSPTTAYFSAPPAQQQQRNNSLPYPPRPRISSSMSASGAHGAGAGKASNSAGSGNAKSRGQVERSQSIPSAPLSGGVPLGDPPPSGWKGKLKQAEQDADRMGKELEIARWRLTVVEEEQRAAEREVRSCHARLTTLACILIRPHLQNQEALKALAARAMRAEARIKLFETAASRSEAAEERSPVRSEPVNEASTSFEGSPPTQAAAAPPENANVDEEAVADDSIKIGRSTATMEILPKLQLNGSASADELSESSLDKPVSLPSACLCLDQADPRRRGLFADASAGLARPGRHLFRQ